jgi:hypothetical protein
VCAEPFQPGVNPRTFAGDYAAYLSAIGQAQQAAPEVSAEPPLKCYVFASCQIKRSPSTGRRKPGSRRQRARKPNARRRPSFTG